MFSIHKLNVRKAMEGENSMNLENDIPDYAMVPAKQYEEKTLMPVTNCAIHTPMEVTNVLDGKKFTFAIEEDVLVPDIKPDLKEILIMEGFANLSTREIKDSTNENEYTTISGDLSIQTLYLPEKPDSLCPVISIESMIPFKEQCKVNKADSIQFFCHVDKIDYSVIIERKYRIKIVLTISTKEYNNITLNLFDGLKGENLHFLKENTEFSSLFSRKKDILSIKEYISPISDTIPGQILFKDIAITENYKQITPDKIILNGFVCLNILYYDKPSNDDLYSNMHQLKEKIEFTQFIPLQNANNISYCNISFDSSQLRLKICQHEDGQDIFQLEGDLITYVELFKSSHHEIITDAYHKEKNFVFDKKETNINILMGTTNNESSVREIFVPRDITSDIESILFTTGQITKSNHYYEQNKIITEGTISVRMICKLATDDSQLTSITEEIPFRTASSICDSQVNGTICQQIYLKDFWSEKINGRQLEFNSTIVTVTEIIKPVSFTQLTNPAFQVGSSKETSSPIVIYCCKKNDSLWHIAKKFRTSTEAILSINNLEKEDLCEGQKLLIMR